ncbi:hypothetical protein BHM03_00017821 [Ensete ventricosum]|nr:hypothetical protein BHM03_00017821 [Ensete ventricosum]
MVAGKGGLIDISGRLIGQVGDKQKSVAALAAQLAITYSASVPNVTRRQAIFIVRQRLTLRVRTSYLNSASVPAKQPPSCAASGRYTLSAAKLLTHADKL